MTIVKKQLKKMLFVGKNTVVYDNNPNCEESLCRIEVFCENFSKIPNKNYRPFKDITEFIKNKPELMTPRKCYCSFSFYCYNQSDKTISVGGIDYCTFKEMFDDEYAKISYDGLNWKRFGIEVKE